ncbi:uncharacterized protein C16orf96 homolog [Tenrec ecaudatus]|uniref:uncharacterized protein C16orf96 homolog n=1 Tax=Tenrec ecaudatus TaxID=94439 RepID=UPI003F5AA599
MDFSVTYTELVNIAIPQVGVVNFQALHLLLQGILEHIHLGELKKVLSGDEDFLQSSQLPLVPREGDAQPIQSPMKRLNNVFDHVLSRMDKVESQVASMKELPSTTQLLEASQGSERPVKDLWNFIKLRKMAEGNAEATAKVMQVLQELLSNLNSTQGTVEKLRVDVDILKDQVEKVNIDKCDALVDDLRRQNRRMTNLQQELSTIQKKMSSLPKNEELVLWSGLHEAMFHAPAATSEEQDTQMKPEGSLESSLQKQESTVHSIQPLPEAPELQTVEYMEPSLHTPRCSLELKSPSLSPRWKGQKPGLYWSPAQHPDLHQQPLGLKSPSPGPSLSPRLAHTSSGLAHTSPRLAHTSSRLAHTSSGLAHNTPWLAHNTSRLAHTSSRLAHNTPRLAHVTPHGLAHTSSRPAHNDPHGLAHTSSRPAHNNPHGLAHTSSRPANNDPHGLAHTSSRLAHNTPRLAHTSSRLAHNTPRLAHRPWSLAYARRRSLSELQQPGHPQYPFSRAPPPARELGSAWPRPLQPYKSRHSSTAQFQVIKERAGEQFAVPPKEKPSKEKSSKAPRSALQRMRTTATIAAAAAAAYAAAANSAAQAAQAAAKRVKDAPATKMASLASATASAGPLGVFMDDLGAGTSRGATSVVALGEDVNGDNYYYSPQQSVTTLPYQPSFSSSLLPTQQVVSAQDKKKAVEKSMSYIATLPARHDSMKEEFAQLYTKLQQHLNYIANVSASGKLGNTVDMLQEKMRSIQKSRMKEEELERMWGNKIQMMKDHYILLDRNVEKIQLRMDEFKILQDQIKNLQVTKMDKNEVEQELKEKADRITLARKASRVDLETLAVELNETMHGLLLKLTTNEEEWKKSIEELTKVVGTKLVHSDLDDLKKEMAEVWELIKRLLLEGFRFDPDSAAGFRKKLFERVKCISCDRPVEMMTGPHLITIRRGHLLSQLRPASANSYEYLQRQQMREQQYLQHVQDLAHSRGPVDSLGSQQEWGDGPRNAYLSTIYPYGDPQLLDYDTAEVDILGVDGILYKGRMHTTSEIQPVLKEHAVVKGPRPPSRNLGDRVRNGALFGAIYPSLFPPLSTGIPTLGSHLTVSPRPPSLPPRPPSLPPRPPSLPLMPLLPRLIPTLRDPQQAPGSARHWKSLRFEVRGNTQSKEGPAGP